MTKMKVLILVIVLIITAITGFVYFGKYRGKLNYLSSLTGINNFGNQNKTDTNPDIVSDNITCEKDWKYYKQDVLGIEFCYPPSWGEPKTDPFPNLTRLSQMEKDFKDQNVAYYNSVNIIFTSEDNNFPDFNILIFNPQYKIEDEQPYNYYENGATNEVTGLISKGDICTYNIAMEKPFPLQTVSDDCKNGIKTILTDDPGYLDSYDVRFLAFERLQNGYFDNVLISYPFDQAHQAKEKVNNLDEFFNTKMTTEVVDGLPKKNKSQLDQERKVFEKFVSSISSFKPTEKEETKFETIAGEGPNATLIRKYYWLLENGKLDQAYAISSGGAKDFSEYQTWYGNVYSAKPMDINQVSGNRYDFYVDYQDHNNPKTKYHVIMDVNGSKIDTQLAEEITSEEIKSGNNVAFTKKKSGKNYAILNKNGKEIIVDEGVANYNEAYSNIADVKFFRDVEFSPSGSFLIYRMFGWEWSVEYIYDIEKEKIVFEENAGTFSFTPDEKHLYTCNGMGMSSTTEGKVYVIPEFKTVYVVPEKELKYQSETIENGTFSNGECSYDPSRNAVLFSFNNENSSELQIEKRVYYNLSNATVEIE